MKNRILLGLLMTCGAAHAAEWVIVPLTNQSKEVLIDNSSVSVSGPVRRAWFKFVMPPHTKKGVGIYESRFVANVLMRTVFDCEQKNSKTDGTQWFYEDGTDSTTTYPATLEWTPVPPESMADALLTYICAWKPK